MSLAFVLDEHLRGPLWQTILRQNLRGELLLDVARVGDPSIWIKEEHPPLADFHWQNGYGAFSVSPSHVDPLKEYIANQVEHHRHESYQDEFRRLCKKYGVEIDERYVWD